MENPLDPIFEEREELMISPTGDGDPNLRTAHFINPSSTSRNAAVSELPPLPHSSRFGFSDQRVALDVYFRGRRDPPKKWKEWVDSLRSRYEPTWKKLGIFDAIMNSTYKIYRDHDLVLGVAEKWCPETNTFIFPWGEATITLEDMMVLGGYPVLGHPHFSSVESDEMRMVLDDLHEVYRKLEKTRSRSGQLTTCVWMEHFIGTGHELEHDAFLSVWLTRFVYPYHSFKKMGRKMLPVAIHLARGIPIALAPLVLASIYKDLSLLKQEMVKSVSHKGECGSSMLELWAPLQLVQLWVWERFPTLSPKPNSIELGEPRAARWHRVPKLKAGNVRVALDSAGDCFRWRPYASGVSNWQLPKFYREQEEWVSVGPELDEELESFARCIRISEISEPGGNGIQQYLPHRVAMQFGLDQDIPGCVPQSSKAMDLKVAWSNYSRPIGDSRLYIPPRLFESDVTKKYFDWWKQSVLKVKSMAIVKKLKNKRRVGSFVEECESLLPQELRSMNKEGNAGEPFSCSDSKSCSSSTRHGRLKYKSLEEIAQSEAAMQAMKVSNCGVNTTSPGSPSGEDSIDVMIVKPKLKPEDIGDGVIKKPKLEEKKDDEMSKVDKAIAELKVEFANRPDNPFKVLSTDEVEKLIAELKQEFGMSSEY